MGKGGAGALDKVKLMVGIQPEPTSILDEFGEFATLSRKQRIIGFVICLFIGFIINLASAFLFFKPVAFAVLFTIGNIVSLGSTMFLNSPSQQWKNMTDRTRLGSSIAYLFFMILTLVMALKVKSVAGTLVCCFLQWLALIWYGLSYIPFARQAIQKMLGSAVAGG